jgi:hypothetical protein
MLKVLLLKGCCLAPPARVAGRGMIPPARRRRRLLVAVVVVHPSRQSDEPPLSKGSKEEGAAGAEEEGEDEAEAEAASPSGNKKKRGFLLEPLTFSHSARPRPSVLGWSGLGLGLGLAISTPVTSHKKLHQQPLGFFSIVFLSQLCIPAVIVSLVFRPCDFTLPFESEDTV